MGTVHQKVFPVVCDKFASEDNGFYKKCVQLQDVTPDMLGVDPKLSCPLPAAVSRDWRGGSKVILPSTCCCK